jgi:hypothetical protein
LSRGADDNLGKRANYSGPATDRAGSSRLGSAESSLGSTELSVSATRLGGELAVLAANAPRNRENDAIESCIAAGRGGRLRIDAQIVPAIKKATGIINHSKTPIDLPTVPSVPSAFNVQRSLAAHPGDRAIGKALLLPDRHSCLPATSAATSRSTAVASGWAS